MPLLAWQLSQINDANEWFFSFMDSLTIYRQVGFASAYIFKFLVSCRFYRIPIGSGNQDGIIH